MRDDKLGNYVTAASKAIGVSGRSASSLQHSSTAVDADAVKPLFQVDAAQPFKQPRASRHALRTLYLLQKISRR